MVHHPTLPHRIVGRQNRHRDRGKRRSRLRSRTPLRTARRRQSDHRITQHAESRNSQEIDRANDRMRARRRRSLAAGPVLVRVGESVRGAL